MEPEKIHRNREVVLPHVVETYADGRCPRLFRRSGIKSILTSKIDTPRKISSYCHDYSFTEIPGYESRLNNTESTAEPMKLNGNITTGSTRFVGYLPHSKFVDKIVGIDEQGGTGAGIQIKQCMRLLHLRNRHMSR